MRSPAIISICWACSRQVGRFFHAADEHGPDSAPYVVLSDALWRNAFHADPGIVGTTVELNKHPFTVVGVAPAQFHGTERFRVAGLLDAHGERGAGGGRGITCIAGHP